MRRAVLVHGVFSSSDTFETLAQLLASRQTSPIRYDYWPNDLIAARLLNRRRSRDVAKLAESLEAQVGVGHSNGCTILHGAARRGAPFKLLVYINPALDAEPDPLPPWVKRVYVLHAPDDWAVWFGKLLLLHPWGDMGRNGYKGIDQRWINLNVGTGLVWSPARRTLGQRDTPVWDYQPSDHAHGHSGAKNDLYWITLVSDLAAGRLVIG